MAQRATSLGPKPSLFYLFCLFVLFICFVYLFLFFGFVFCFLFFGEGLRVR